MITAPSARFVPALSYSHHRQVRVKLYTVDGIGGRTYVTDLKFNGGELTLDAHAASCRRLT